MEFTPIIRESVSFPFNHRNSSLNRNESKQKSSKYIETLPNRIILVKVIDQKFYEGRIQLKNLTNNFVVYRFFNNHHMTYTISPSVYFIKPFETFTVNIKRFDKASIDEAMTKDKLLLVAMESENKMTDINDAKNYIKKEDLYSPSTQQLNLDVELDNGSNSQNYYNIINERKTIIKEYNEQLNINAINSIEELGRHIEDVKGEIEKYNTQIEELMHNLKDVSSNNVVKKPNIYFDKNLFEEKLKKNMEMPESLPLFLVIFCCCVGLFIGKFIHKIL
jgi:hypothetical protein